jgi:amino acid adenylation domain-containing protein/non-ribosomal peptide synthase protein (TIGR01720 family)
MLDRKQIKDVYELSPLQKGMLFHHIKDGNSPAYFEQMTLFLDGQVDVSHLEESLNGLIAKYDVLRTNFVYKNVNEPMQVVWKEKHAKIIYKDLSSLSESEQQEFIAEYKQEDIKRGFDLTRDLLIRFTLIRLGQRKYQLIWSHHHILMDGWCFGILFSDLLDMYQRRLHQQTIPMEPVTGYSEYIRWLGRQDQDEAVNYWRRYLEGYEQVTSLAISPAASSASDGYQKSETSLTLSSQQTSSLHALAKKYQVTLNSVIQSIWGVLLHNYHDTNDIAFGAVVSGRSSAIRGVEHIVGLFINTIPVRISDFYGDFGQLVQAVHESSLQSGAFEHVSLSEIQKVTDITGDLFDHILVFENYPLDEDMMDRSRQSGFAIQGLEVFEQSNYNAHVLIMPSERLSINISFNELVYHPSTIEKLLAHLETIVDQVIANPNILVNDIDILTQAERTQLMEWSHRPIEYPRESTVHSLFEQQAEKTPNRVALMLGHETLTYEEVNNAANRMAHYLCSLGVKQGDLVAVAMERSIHLYIGILAILKSGAAYVPIDLNYPADRLAYLFEDSEASYLITTGEQLPKFSGYTGKIICVDQEITQILAEPSDNLSVSSSSEDLAYIMYTSGSTGKPKGVSVRHRGIVRLVKENDYVNLDSDQTMLQLAPIAFDASTLEIWGGLLNGGRVAIMPPGTPTVEQIAVALKEYEVTVLWLTSGLFTLVADHALDALRGVKQLLVGGDIVSVPHVRKVLQLGGVQVINGYGPTENTTFTCCYPVPADWSGSALPIGRPIRNTEVYIMNSRMKLAPLGAIGELLVGGDGLAREYWRRPELTEERFLPHPFSTNPDARLYRTGDLVRYLPDGNIEFLGRMDNQVKIRGYRIELGEVEAAFVEHPSVREVVALVTEDKQLVVYLALELENAAAPMSTSEWREYAQGLLPEYMVPAAYIVLDSFPLNPNGKIDRNALPSPGDYLQNSADYAAPTTEIEALLAQAWGEVLKVKQVGIYDHFFELGGDSIHAIQVAARLHRHNYRLELKDLFQNPVIAKLAPYIKSDSIRVDQGMVEGEAPLTPVQQWFFEKNIRDSHHWNQAMLLKRKEGWHVDSVNTALRELIKHHDALRMVFTEQEGRIKAYNQGLDDQSFEAGIYDLTYETDVEAAMKIEADRLQRALNLEKGPLLTAGVFQTPVEDYLLLIIHHLVVDGVSWRILLEDFNTAYEQALLHKAIVLPPKTSSFMDWAHALQAYGNSRQLLREGSYWEKAHQSTTAKLPVDKAGDESYYYKDYQSVHLHLDEEPTRLLITESHRAYHTQINDILLSALVLTIQEWAGGSAISIQLEGHGREEIIPGIDLNRTVGWFTSIYPVLFETGSATPSDIIPAVKETLRRIPNKGIGYGVLKYLTSSQTDSPGPEDSKSVMHPSLEPEISFNYLGQFDKAQGEGFMDSSMPVGDTVSPWTTSTFKLEINGMITDGTLKLEFGYNPNLYFPETIGRLTERFHHHLLGCLEHCIAANEQWTPSDYSMEKLSFEELNTIHQTWNPKAVQSMSYLSPMQEGMLFHYLKDKSSPVYFEQIDFQLEGSVDLECLEKGINDLVQKHEVFRTVFLYEGLNRPVQLVLKDRTLNAYYEDISHLPEAKRADYVNSFKKKDRDAGMDLMADHLIRFALIRTAEQQYHLIWSFHHILIDGWCLGLVLNDLLEMYRYRLNQEEIPVSNATPYADYIHWLEGLDREEARDYWKAALEGYDEVAAIPQRDTQSDISERMDKQLDFVIERELSEGIAGLAKKSQVTQNTVFRAIWGLLLQRYNLTDDVVFGAVVSGRTSAVANVEEIVGLFINTIPVRVQSKPEDTFESLLQRVQHQSSQAEPYSYLSLSDIQSVSQITGGLFNHIIAFENYPLDTNTIDEKSDRLGFKIQNADTVGQTNYDLDVLVLPGEDITLKISFNEAVYEERMIRLMFGHLLQVIRQVLTNPEITLNSIEIVDASEKQQLFSFNDTALAYPRDKVIHQLFEEQAQRTPHHVSVVCGNESLTYETLNKRANQLAAILRERHISRDSIVGILVKPSLDMLAAVLGVLKAGAAYLPIDPAYPAERIEYMLNDSGAQLLLTQEGLGVPQGYDGRVLLLNHPDIAKQPDANPELINESSELAYVIYTSGSTGRPKGVMVEHRTLVNLSFWHNHAFEVTENDRSTKFAGFGFDASVWEIFPYLIKGASLYIIQEELRYDVHLLNEYYEREGITISFLPTQFAEQFMETNNSSLRMLLIGGERAQRIPKVKYQVVNNYGPTENTVCATSHLIDPEDTVIPIGRPVANNKVYILDKNLQLQPVGIVGELCVAGDSVARGYLNQPDLTAEVFVTSPYIAGERMYRTGDLARWLPNGVLEYVGRADDQIKIRGYRIELGEIEGQLLKHAGVNEAVVIANTSAQGQVQLGAYVTLKQPVSMSELRQYLANVLPDYMIPGYMMELEQLPLTANGKVDRKALPEPPMSAEQDYVSPRTEQEQLLADVWKEVLQVEAVGIHDNFFTLGGDSIKAIQVAARLHRYSLKLEVNHLFQNPTVFELTPYLQAAKSEIDQSSVIGDVPLTPIQHWFFNQQFDEPHHWNQDMLLFKEEGYDEAAVEQSFRELVGHHDALRMRYTHVNNEWKQQNLGLDDHHFDMKVYDLTQSENVREQIEQEAGELQRSLHIEQGPLLRLGLFRTQDGDHLLIIIHHLVVDGISWRILLEDFNTIYEQVLAGQPIQLPLKTTSFQTWARGLEQYADSETLIAELPYWTKIQETQVETLTKDRDGDSTYRIGDSGSVIMELSEEETRSLLTDSHQAYQTEINDLLLTALVLSVRDWSGGAAVAVDLEGHGREEIMDGVDLTRTVGWFTTMYPVVFDETFENISGGIKLVKETLRQVPNKGIGYGLLKHIANRDRLPLHIQPEISFNYLGQFQQGQGDGFGQSSISTGQAVSPLTTSSYSLSINGMVMNGKLRIIFGYNPHQFDLSSVEAAANRYKLRLLDIVAHCMGQDEVERTPSDFSMDNLTFEDLDLIFETLKEKI